jgi:hypothetical protein
MTPPTASEALAALDGEQQQYGWPGPPVRRLFAALPALIEVVEAAEQDAFRPGTRSARLGSEPLADALANLTRELTKGT